MNIDIYRQALCVLGKNGALLKLNREPYSITDTGKVLNANIRLAGGGRRVFQVKQMVLFLVGVPFNSNTHQVVHLDGNYRNCAPENLKVIRRIRGKTPQVSGTLRETVTISD